jgi:type IV secretory pathway protease TraF
VRIGRFHLSWRRVVESVAMVGIAILLALAVQAYVIKPFVVPTPSMASTVAAGDRVLVERFSYHFTSVHRDDVIVFTGHGPIPLLKRVVGLPGDTLSLHHGRLYVNNHPAPTTGPTASTAGIGARFCARRSSAKPSLSTGPRPTGTGSSLVLLASGPRARALASFYWPPAHEHGL